MASRLLGTVTACVAVVFSVVVVTPLAAGAVTAPDLGALGAPSPIATVPEQALEPVVGSSPPTSRPVPTMPAPSSQGEILALAERPAPAVSAVEAPAGPPPTQPAGRPETSDTTTVTVPGASGGTVDLALASVRGTDEPAPPRAVTSDRALLIEPVPDEPFECHERATSLPLEDGSGTYGRNLVAQLVHTVFGCVTAAHGYGDVPATSSSAWDGAATWGFTSMAEMVAAEAVVVGYCESQAFAPFAIGGNNPWGYGGVFQMGDREMRNWGFPGASKFDPVDNVYSAANLFVYGADRGQAWGGWGPWAVVNTGYNDEVNDKVKVPVLPRFVSTDPAYRGRAGVELPEWAVDPWSYEVPEFDGCPFTGRDWPQAVALATATG